MDICANMGMPYQAPNWGLGGPDRPPGPAVAEYGDPEGGSPEYAARPAPAAAAAATATGEVGSELGGAAADVLGDFL